MRAPQPKVLSRPQFETLEVLVEAIIPTDDRSPGAKQARVADYIDLLLSEVRPRADAAVVRRARGAGRRRDVAVPLRRSAGSTRVRSTRFSRSSAVTRKRRRRRLRHFS